MTEEERPAKTWPHAAHDFLDARGFAPGPSLFRAIADALAAFFAESRPPLRIPLALEWFQKPEVMAMFADQTGPLGFAEVRRVAAIITVEFPQATVEHVRVALNMLEDGGLLESAYREIDSGPGAATPVSAEAVAALLRRVAAPGPDGVAAAERLARVSLDRWMVMPPEPVDGSVRVASSEKEYMDV